MSTEQLDAQHFRNELRKLKVSYEKYFSAAEKRPPSQEHALVKKMLVEMQKKAGNNTARKFLCQQCQSSLLTYERQWSTICQRIEDGTYQREPGGRGRQGHVHSPKTASQSNPSKSTASSIDALHNAYNKAQKDLGGTKSISKDALSKTIERQREAIKKRYGCETVDFKVKVKEGKVVLSAVVPQQPKT
jgi:hypothetical protein